jgi:glyoxylase-like metal-dependent hydrolase (beta-lactamase superfamily II)
MAETRHDPANHRAHDPAHHLAHDRGFFEVADRVWVARYEFLDVNVGLIGGDRGLLVVDTQTSEVEARRTVDQVRRLGVGDVVAVVNTHHHFDHTFGNVVFSEQYGGPPMFIHEAAADRLAQDSPLLKDEAARSGDDPEDPERQKHLDIAASRILVPTETFSSARVVDLGDRLVELVHPGRGHTGGDTVIRVPDADVLFAGDLVEESAVRAGVPGFGGDCFPLEWPSTLELVESMLGPSTVVVPGHGLPVDRDFVGEQRASIGAVAETVRDLAGKGVRVADALAAAQWPYPVAELEHAVRRAYEQLPRSAKTLPLL